MDHLPIPPNPIRPPLDVPYLCDEEYDRGHFLTYPNRKGIYPLRLYNYKASHLSSNTQPRNQDYLSKEHQGNDNKAGPNLGPFFQNWLYFGLLSEWLGPAFTTTDFIREGPLAAHGNLYVTTHKLPDLLREQYRLRRRFYNYIRFLFSPSRGSDYNWSRGRHLDYCLGVLHEQLTIINSLPGPPILDPRILLACAALGQTLQHELPDWYKGRAWQMPLSGDREDNRGVLEDRLRKDGWCPADIRRLRFEFSLTSVWYMSHMPYPRSHISHSMCSNSRCYGSKIEPSKDNKMIGHSFSSLGNILQFRSTNRRPAEGTHVQKDCQCTHVHADQNELYDMLRQGHIPVIKGIEKSGSGSYKFKLVASSDEEPYIAFSHVWSDGLGNPRENALPLCQVQRLLKYANVISQHKGLPTNIWVDTICCPTAPHPGNSLCLAQMRNIYKQASAVIVLDNYLLTLPTTSAYQDPVGLSFQILTSSWNRRLWTLQEGLLNSCVLIGLSKYSLIDVDLIGIMAARQSSSDLRNKRLNGEIFYELTLHFRRQRTGFFRDLLKSGNRIEFTQKSLAFRELTVATDEPICVACINDMDVDMIAAESPHLRIQKLWSLFPEIPQDIIFQPGEKLTQPGFRWAPASLITYGSVHGPLVTQHLIVFNWDEARNKTPAERTEDGLTVTFPGILLTAPAANGSAREHYNLELNEEFVVTVDKQERLLVTYAPSLLVGDASTSGEYPESVNIKLQTGEQTLALVLKRAEIPKLRDFRSVEALLVAVKGRRGGILLARRICLVKVSGYQLNTIAAHDNRKLHAGLTGVRSWRGRGWLGGKGTHDEVESKEMGIVRYVGQKLWKDQSWCID